MPRYCYYCPLCGFDKEEVKSWCEVGEIVKCPECNNVMNRDYKAENVGVHADSYSRPIVSDSLAIMPSQVEEHKRLHPNIKLDKQCRPIFDNYKDHEAYLKKTGFVKNKQRNRRKATKVLGK